MRRHLLRTVESRLRIGRNTTMLWNGYLTEVGWTETVLSQIPQDRDGQPLPWFTYASIALLEQRTPASARVFEYGAGQSTLWWSSRVAHVVSVEHDRGWYDDLRAKVPGNVDLRYCDVGDDAYPRMLPSTGERFEIVVIDGRRRVECADSALSCLTDDGVVVWDNAEREEYQVGLDALVEQGMRRLDLVGLGPINPYGWTTSVLYRDGNCLGL
jgi:hypothetical protein